MRVGLGYDAHRLVEGRELFLGGIKIPFEKGLLGHSDADVLIHAIADAILGAMAAGDLGHHFPDAEPELMGISSCTILERVRNLLEKTGGKLINIDAVVIAEQPKISPFVWEMREKLASILKTPSERISIKAKTNEGMGFTGRGEGITAYAVVLIEGM
ncbi:MAG: 2-C-methyl-D-erythritol 2,4-cyclodiphosphate synthase [Candidatus Edwardsbacteria bacterium]